MTVASSPEPLIGRDEFLRMEDAAPAGVRLERMDGYVYAMAGASLAHERVVARLVATLSPSARAHGCEVFASNRRLSIAADTDFLPDVSVYCDPTDDDAYAGHRPCLVVEVLSRSPALDDLNLKVPRYQAVPSVTAVILVNPEPFYLDIFRRDADGWTHEHHTDPAAVVALDCPPCDLALADLT